LKIKGLLNLSKTLSVLIDKEKYQTLFVCRGARGLWIDSDLKYGSSSPCKTFSNPTLASSQDFTVQGVELWGFELIT